ncbi:hypothetical protein [Roseofilum sp. Belize Diploria]|uniref:hypothetical protein n=1 Tax=Roseofilum sp. Belize Diploria TaxID=2821501 RepID=UPI001B2F0708|nr:hypothetical protein [Roseofilum sp. Belize Diploria]MBP0008067.1 hypothetical protein [Roseofilum sp. Belize Diploria]
MRLLPFAAWLTIALGANQLYSHSPVQAQQTCPIAQEMALILPRHTQGEINQILKNAGLIPKTTTCTFPLQGQQPLVGVLVRFPEFVSPARLKKYLDFRGIESHLIWLDPTAKG